MYENTIKPNILAKLRDKRVIDELKSHLFLVHFSV